MVWCLRRLLARLFPWNRVWGVERPALETWTAILAFAPVVGWLGNPAWWRETLPRLAHYYTLNTNRRGALPDIQIIYFGQIYEYSLPWHNAWVLLGDHGASHDPGGCGDRHRLGLGQVRRDRLPLYFLVHFLTLPVLRMLPTPAHDGVRLFPAHVLLPRGVRGLGNGRAGQGLHRRLRLPTRVGAASPGRLGRWRRRPSTWSSIHPFELSYYNVSSAARGGPGTGASS